jgi:hypothetical protein
MVREIKIFDNQTKIIDAIFSFFSISWNIISLKLMEKYTVTVDIESFSYSLQGQCETVYSIQNNNLAKTNFK